MINIFNETFTLNKDDASYSLNIYQDEDASSPWEIYDHFSKMFCWHNRYNLGDENPFDSPTDFIKWLVENYKPSEYVLKKVYLYDHSGICLSLDDFKDLWDSGQVGYIYVLKDDVYKCDPDTTDWQATAEDIINSEFTEYNTWLTGEVMAFSIVKHTICACCGQDVSEVVDSMTGFYGTDVETNGVFDYIPEEFISMIKEEYKNA